MESVVNHTNWQLWLIPFLSFCPTATVLTVATLGAPHHRRLLAPHPRSGNARELAPAQAERFKERSAAERVNNLLKV